MGRHTILPALALLLACCGADKKPDAKADKKADAKVEAKADADADADKKADAKAEAPGLSFADAIKKAREKQPDLPVIEVEHETVDGKKLLEVEFLKDGGIFELYMDPNTGEVVKEKTEELSEAEAAAIPELEKLLKAGEFDIDRALALVTDKTKLEGVREVELIVHGGKIAIKVETVVDGEEVAKAYDQSFAEIPDAKLDEGDDDEGDDDDDDGDKKKDG